MICPHCDATVLSTGQIEENDDIVERLREWPHGHKTMIVSEAIDEIERLRAALRITPRTARRSE